MRLLSNALTWQFKFLYLPVVILIAASIAIPFPPDPAAKYTSYDPGNPTLLFLILAIPLSAYAYAYGVRLKKVTLDGSVLVISNYVKEIRVPLRNVESVKGNWLKMPEVITIRFRESTEFGNSIVFAPWFRLFSTGLFAHPVVAELDEIVQKAQPFGERTVEHPIRFARLYDIWIRIRFSLLSHLPHPEIKKGDRFEAVTDFKAGGMTHWNAPFTGGFDCLIPKGTVLVANYDSVRGSTGFGAVPENYTEMEKRLVPEEDRNAPKYGGYSLVLKYRLIGKRIRKL